MSYDLERVARQASEAKELAVHTSRALRDLKRGTKTGLSGRDRFVRHAVLRALAAGRHGINYADVWRERYGERAVTDPAMTTVPTWAVELAPADVGEFLADGQQPLALSRLAPYGRSVSLAGIAALKIPFRAPGADVGGWVAEGAPIPVDDMAFGTVSLSPRKAAAISIFSGELKKRANTDIEALIDTALRADLAAIVDAALLDDQPASVSRPPGLRYNVTAVAASAATDPVAAMRADLAKLVGEIVAGGGTMPVFIVSPVQAVSLSFVPALGYPVIDTVALDPGVVIAVDGPGFVSGVGGAVVDSSKDATFHTDTVPLPVVAGGLAAAPTRSLWQTDSIAVRAIVETAWGVPAGRVAWMEAVKW
ncbi:phage major capsid protein [Sinorhizobium medicae]|uniref:phage major capsid protein n=1 Tax=Sinorhizobium medicae TaxID=110321 RepID=UPI000FD84207|nr:phage major capsid protein [Sinorhizobium medicae]RVJ23438.1 phage major capsid protein [Sinorhizobium medicae]